jgi:hypothetical protein
VSFWNWRRASVPPVVHGNAALATSPELAPIELYTAETRIVGWIAPDGHRVTDLLSSQSELRLWRPSPGPLDDRSVPLPEGAPAPDDAAGEWQTLATDSVVLAMPPEWRASRQLRLHRRLRRAAVLAGPFNVTGNVHLPPGAEVGLHLARSHAFLPLTDAYLLHTGDPSFEHVVSVVIVNTAHVARIAPLVTLA